MTPTEYAGPDRREPSSFNLQVALAKLIAKVDSIEAAIAAKIESMEVLHEATDAAFKERVETTLSRIEATVAAVSNIAQLASIDATKALQSITEQDHRLSTIETTGRGMLSSMAVYGTSLQGAVTKIRQLEAAPGAASLRVLKWAGGIIGSVILVGIASLVWLAIKK